MKKWLLVVPIVSLLLLAFVQLNGLLLTAEWGLKSAIYFYTGHLLNYDSAYLQDGKLILNNPHLDNGRTAYADSLVISGVFNRHSRVFDLDLALENPRYNTTIQDTNFKKNLFLFSKSQSWIPINLRYTLNGGIIQCSFPDERKSPMIFRVSRDSSQLLIEGDFEQSSCQCLMDLLVTNHPKIGLWEISSGTIDGVISMVVPENQNPFLKGDLTIHEITLKSPESFLKAGCENISIHLEPEGGDTRIEVDSSELNIDFSSPKISLTSSQLKGKGTVKLADIDDWESWDLKLAVDEGRVDIQSSAKVQMAGLVGTLDLTLAPQKEIISLNLNGSLGDIIELLPQRFKKKIHQEFDQDRIGIAATIERDELKGVIHIGKPDQSNKDLIHFGFDISTKPQGWFYANQISLAKYMSPLLFPTQNIFLKGIGEFKGSLDGDLVTLKYGVDGLSLENDHYLMKMPTTYLSPEKKMTGYHSFSLSDMTHHGTLPIERGSYLEKHTGVVFSGISTLGIFEEGICYLEPIEAFCNNVFFQGQVVFDYRDPAPGFFSVRTKVSECKGKVSDIKNLLNRIDQPKLLGQFSVEGDVSCRGKGMIFDCDFTPDKDHFHVEIEAALSNGTLDLPSLHAALKDLSVDIDYHNEEEKLTFRDIHGTMLVGRMKNAKEYLVGGSHVIFCGLEGKDLSLDLTLAEGNRQIAAISGRTSSIGDGRVEFVLDSKYSHLGNIYPTDFKLVTTDWSDIDQFRFELEFPFQPFLNYLQRFEDSGWLLLSKKQIAALSFLNVSGDRVKLNLGYDGFNQFFSYQLTLDNLSIYDKAFNRFFVKGRKQGKKWLIDQLLLDRLSLSAELSSQHDDWNIDFLGMRYGESLLVGIDGRWSEEEGLIESHINLLEWNLSDLTSLVSSTETVTRWNPRGQLRGKGSLSVSLLPRAPWLKFNSTIEAVIEGGATKDYSAELKKPFIIQLNSESGVSVDDLQFSLSSHEGEVADCHCQKVTYEPGQNQWQLDRMMFTIAPEKIASAALTLQKEFPEEVTPTVKELISNLKMNEDLIGTLSWSEGYGKLLLNDGKYRYKHHLFDLKDCVIEVEGQMLSLAAQSSFQRCSLYIQSHSAWPSLNSGDIIFTNLNGANNLKPLHLTWRSDSHADFGVESIVGSCAGFTCSLAQNGNRNVLDGTIEMNLGEASSLVFSEEMLERVRRLKTGGRFEFDGRWKLDFDESKPFMDQFSFQGKMMGNQTQLKGYQIDSLEIELDYLPPRLDMKNLQIKDAAGSLNCEVLTLIKNPVEDICSLWVPKTVIKNFRPSLLKDLESAPVKTTRTKTFIVNRLDLDDFYGELDDPSTWQGTGNFRFSNTSRKYPAHPIFAIPAELILRLGLDPHVLNPVTGTVNFNLSGDRFYFTKFKDVYSEGRGSKFYLAGEVPSWMDIDGKLSVHVRMKQYNLMFKIAELFTVSVQGSLKKPSYSLKKAASGR